MRYLPLFALTILFMSCNSKPEAPPIHWVFVEGGTFVMGMDEPLISPAGDTIHGFTTPAHEVTVSDFYISKYEITVGQFRDFCDATGYSMPEPPNESAYGEPIDYEWQDEYPMLATWTEARAFAEWVGGRLPTEAEWEFAAEGGNKSKGYAYSGSDTAYVVGWVAENADSSLHPVGLLPPNELGLHDMTGNLNEWVADWYNPEYDYLNSPKVNPVGPPTGDQKVSKGTGWYYKTTDNETGEPLKYSIQRAEVQYQSPVETRNFGFGFRVAKDAL